MIVFEVREGVGGIGQASGRSVMFYSLLWFMVTQVFALR